MTTITPLHKPQRTDVSLHTLAGRLNSVAALVDSIIRAGYLDFLPPDRDSVESVNSLLQVCRREVQQAIELSELCEENYLLRDRQE